MNQVKRDASTMTSITFDQYYDNVSLSKEFSRYVSTQRPKTGYLEPFEITWKELSYKVSKNTKTILNNISGSLKSGQIMAIMGPSGAGKSSLLSCICGQQRNGVTGSITISTKRKVKFSFISQNDYLLNYLTVKESLWFASRLKNRVYADHRMIIKNIINKLMIESCANNRPNRCSGGQLKRISIALELVSRPNILILDEPTSGLDSVTTWQLINTLIDLTQQAEPIAILLTIHQPSAKLFNLFDVIYLLSYDGQCVYNGAPLKIVDYLNDYELKCPEFNNPSDFALEVAAKEHGIRTLMLLSTLTKMEALDLKENHFEMKFSQNKNTLSQIWLLTIRSLITTIRDPFMLPIKIFSYIICAALTSMMYGYDSGRLSGCSQEFTIGDGSNLMKKLQDTFADIFENCAGLIFICIVAWLIAIFPVVLIFPKEVNVFLKEYGNGYYSCFSYFMSKSLSDIPFQLILPNLCSIPVYYMTGQYTGQVWRIYGFALIFILISFNGSAEGFMISVLLAEYPMACAFVGVFTILPMVLLSGVMIRLEIMPFYFRYMSYINFLRYASESVLIDVYGFNRCSTDVSNANNTIDFMELIPTEKMLEIISSDKINTETLISTVNELMSGINDENHSIVMDFFQYNDIQYYISLAMLLLSFICFRVLTYFFILRKVRSK